MQLAEARDLLLTTDPALEEAREAVWRQLAEGVFDPYILKCVFMAGGGGSGKGFISELMFGTTKDMATTSFGVKVLNSDDILAALAGNLPLQKERPSGYMVGGAELLGQGLGGRDTLDLKTQLGTERGQRLRGVAKALAKKREKLFVNGRLGLIIDGTADDFVNTTLEVALERNAQRARVVPEKFVIQAHKNVQKAIPKFRSMFGKRFYEVDNSETLTKSAIRSLGARLHKQALKFLSEPLKNKRGWEWLKAETEGMPKQMLSKVTWIGKKRGA